MSASFLNSEYQLSPPKTPTNITWQSGCVSQAHKESLLNQRGCVIWITGLSGSGKSTVACALEHSLADSGKITALLDGDNIRHGLNSNLGFSFQDRQENIRRVGEVAKLFCEAGIITLVSFISPYRCDRDRVRRLVPAGRFIEIHMRTPLSVCESRDPKGLYRRARAGLLRGFTGIDDPYETPESPELALDPTLPDGSSAEPRDLAARIMEYLRANGFLGLRKSRSMSFCRHGGSTSACRVNVDEESYQAYTSKTSEAVCVPVPSSAAVPPSPAVKVGHVTCTASLHADASSSSFGIPRSVYLPNSPIFPLSEFGFADG